MRLKSHELRMKQISQNSEELKMAVEGPLVAMHINLDIDLSIFLSQDLDLIFFQI